MPSLPLRSLVALPFLKPLSLAGMGDCCSWRGLVSPTEAAVGQKGVWMLAYKGLFAYGAAS